MNHKRSIFIWVVISWLLSATWMSAATLAANSQAPSSNVSLFLPIISKSEGDLYISDVQVIQGSTLSPSYSVYIAGRETTIRTFVGISSGESISGVTGRLCAADVSGTPLGCISPSNDSITAPSLAGKLETTLNFQLPQDWLKPGYGFRVDLDPDNLIPDTNRVNNRFPANGVQPFNFVQTPPLNLVIIPIEYQPFPDSQKYLPKTDNLSYLTELPIKLFPFPTINYQTHAVYRYYPKDSTYNLDNSNGLGWSKLLENLTALHNMEDPSGAKNYYGLVNYFDAHGCNNGCVTGIGWLGQGSSYQTAVGWSGSGAGNQDASETMVHELGHNFGRHHTLCSGQESEPDPNYPYQNGLIGGFGLDVTSQLLYDPNVYADYMSYCEPIWTSDYTYWSIHQFRSSMQAGNQSSQDVIEALYIGGLISPSGEVILRPAYQQEVSIPADMTGPYQLELLGKDGTVLAGYPFQTVEIPDGKGFRGFGFFVPVEKNLSGLRILRDNHTLGENSFGDGFAIAGFIEQPLTTESTGDSTILRWTSPTSSVDQILYRIRISYDSGQTWQVLALDWPEPGYTIPQDSMLYSNGALVEIQASDGIHTSTRRVFLGKNP